MNAPTNARWTTPSASAIERHGDRRELVAPVQLALRLGLDVARRDVGGLEHRDLRRQALTRQADRRREQHDQPRRVGPREVVPVELSRDGIRVARGRLGSTAAEAPRHEPDDDRDRDRDRQPHAHRAAIASAQPPRSRSGTAGLTDAPASPTIVSATTTGWLALITSTRPVTAVAVERAELRGRDRELRLTGRAARVAGTQRDERGGHGRGPGVHDGHERVRAGAEIGQRDRPSAARCASCRAMPRHCASRWSVATRPEPRRRRARCALRRLARHAHGVRRPDRRERGGVDGDDRLRRPRSPASAPPTDRCRGAPRPRPTWDDRRSWRSRPTGRRRSPSHRTRAPTSAAGADCAQRERDALAHRHVVGDRAVEELRALGDHSAGTGVHVRGVEHLPLDRVMHRHAHPASGAGRRHPASGPAPSPRCR